MNNINEALLMSAAKHVDVIYDDNDEQHLHSSDEPPIYRMYDETNQSSDAKSMANLRETATFGDEEKLESISSIASTSTEPEASEAEDMLILLDWDNTIFPTTVIEYILKESKKNKFGFVCVDNKTIKLFKELATRTLLLLSELIEKYGSDNIHIVTNSSNGWIQQSLNHAACITNVYKDIENLLFSHNINMLSAQSMFRSVYKEPVAWKTACFVDLLRTKADYAHILSIGDQHTDHIAVNAAIHSLSYTPMHHMVKLKEAPTVKDMICEMNYMRTAFETKFNVFETTAALEPQILDYHYEESNYYYHMAVAVNAQLNASNSI